MFIVFEGIDGSGKTTLSNRVARALREGGLTVEHVREGGRFGSAVAQRLREVGRDARNLALSPRAELQLLLAREAQLIDECIRPALRRVDVVIADRFLSSAEALARYGRGLPADTVRRAVRAAGDGLEPDLVMLVDVEPSLARARRRVARLLEPDARPPSRKGLAGTGLLHRLREGYLAMAAADPRRWTVVDNDRPLDETVAEVVSLVRSARERGVAPALAQAGPRRTSVVSRASTPEEALPALLAWVDHRAATEPHVAAWLLAGLRGPEVEARREALAERAPEVIAAGLRGLEDASAWNLRRALAGRAPAQVAGSLVGLPWAEPEALELRRELAGAAPEAVARSLTGLDDEGAWRLREALRPSVPDAVLASLAGLGSAKAWALREEAWRGAWALDAYGPARTACQSITGLEDERAWAVRERALDQAPVAAIASLAGLAGERAWEWRQRHLRQAPKTVVGTLEGMTDPRAWRCREALAGECRETFESMIGLDGPIAWRMRETWEERWPAAVVESLGALAAEPRGRALMTRRLAGGATDPSLLRQVALAMQAGAVAAEAA